MPKRKLNPINSAARYIDEKIQIAAGIISIMFTIGIGVYIMGLAMAIKI
jgi:hypothetical protein